MGSIQSHGTRRIVPHVWAEMYTSAGQPGVADDVRQYLDAIDAANVEPGERCVADLLAARFHGPPNLSAADYANDAAHAYHEALAACLREMPTAGVALTRYFVAAGRQLHRVADGLRTARLVTKIVDEHGLDPARQSLKALAAAAGEADDLLIAVDEELLGQLGEVRGDIHGRRRMLDLRMAAEAGEPDDRLVELWLRVLPFERSAAKIVPMLQGWPHAGEPQRVFALLERFLDALLERPAPDDDAMDLCLQAHSEVIGGRLSSSVAQAYREYLEQRANIEIQKWQALWNLFRPGPVLRLAKRSKWRLPF